MSFSAFVGRRQAWRALDAALDRAMRFEAPQFATVLGPPGMGKSRLVTEWLRDVATRGHFRLVEAAVARAGAGARFVGSLTGPEPRGLLCAWLRERFGLDGGLDAASALAMLRTQLQAVFGDRRVGEIASFLAPFLGLELPRGPLAQALSERPGAEGDVTRAVLARFLEEDARATPLVVALEDLDAADDASLDTIEALGRELGQAPLLFVLTARSDLRVRRPAWGRQGGAFATIELEPLTRQEAGALAVSVADPAAFGARGLDELLDLAGGNPGQIMAALAHTLAGGDPDVMVDACLPEAHGVEGTADAQAARRVAELSPAERELLGRASAFGALFWTGGVVALGRLAAQPPDPTVVFAPDPSVSTVRAMLESLEARGYLLRLPESSIAGETEWAFCQAAERALLAASIDPERLRRLRLFAAQWVEGRVGHADLPERFELLGNLFDGGGDRRRAGECFVAAADRANQEGRSEDARTLYLRGVRLLDVDDSVFKMDALHKLGEVTARAGRAREALAHFAEMLLLAWRLDLPAKGGAAHCRIGRLHRGLGNYRIAQRHFELGRALFEVADDRAGVAACLDDLGRIAMLGGDLAAAMRCHREALALREELGDDRGRALTISWLGLCELQRGELLAAERCFRAALTLSRNIEDAHGTAFALMDLAAVERELGRADRACRLLDEARGLVQSLSEPLAEAHLGIALGESYLQDGRLGDAERELLAAHALAGRFGTKRMTAQALRALAEAKLGQGMSAEARALAEQSLEVARQIQVPALEGAALRVMASAELAGAPGDSERGGARELYDRAVELLSERGAELELGRVLQSYADFEERTGRAHTAAALRAQAAGIRARGWNDAEVGLFDRV